VCKGEKSQEKWGRADTWRTYTNVIGKECRVSLKKRIQRFSRKCTDQRLAEKSNTEDLTMFFQDREGPIGGDHESPIKSKKTRGRS